uniref:F-box domain-containing protein n=1 Tax=Nelumbo nucifera TaxID=4432 RepID=A0A822ZHW9_NELNU|nr:TPA_asm: hypothetical protein HUJ06_002360 [Nelumbo nucifera]
MQSNRIYYADLDDDVDQGEFDKIPDSVVLIILNKLADIRSLGRCTAVCKRFNSLVPYVQDVYINIDEVVTINGDSDDSSYSSSHKPRISITFTTYGSNFQLPMLKLKMGFF